MVGHICGSMLVLPSWITFLSKNEKLLFVLHYLRSSRNKEYSSDTPMSAPLAGKADQLPKIPKARLTGLRSFIQKARLTNSSTKQATAKSDAQSKYYDLESIDVDYQAQLRKENATNRVTEQARVGKKFDPLHGGFLNFAHVQHGSPGINEAKRLTDRLHELGPSSCGDEVEHT